MDFHSGNYVISSDPNSSRSRHETSPLKPSLSWNPYLVYLLSTLFPLSLAEWFNYLYF